MSAGWCWCGLHWLPDYVPSHLEDGVRHTPQSCVPVTPQGEEES